MRNLTIDPPATGYIDLPRKEHESYSLVKAINAVCTNNWSKAGLEREISLEIGKQIGRQSNGFFVPNNLSIRATYAVGAPGTGGRLVATDLLAQNFIDVLRNAAVVTSLGATIVTGLVGNVSIPRQATATQTYWVTENSDLTQAEATFDQVTLTPKQIGTRSRYSRLMLQQATPDIESVVRNDLIQQIALGVDLAAINGSGGAQPTGILNTSGIGNFELGANANTGAPLTNASATAKSGLEPLLELEAIVDAANGLNGNKLYYLTNSKVTSAIKRLKSSTNFQPLWSDNLSDTTLGTPMMVNGYPLARTNQVPSNLVKGSSEAIHSALIFGNFSDLIIGMWGALEILPNPYGAGFNSGILEIRAMQTCDIALRHSASFAAIKDIVA